VISLLFCCDRSPRAGHWTNHSSFWLTVNTEYFTEGFDKKQTMKFGQKNVIFMNFKNINKRVVKHCEFLEGLNNPIVEALKYQECFERKGVRTKAEVGEIFGVSRARVVQYLNLLKLPNPIIDYMIKNSEDKTVCQFFTERRLRPLTQIEDKMKCLEKFNTLLVEKNLSDRFSAGCSNYATSFLSSDCCQFFNIP